VPQRRLGVGIVPPFVVGGSGDEAPALGAALNIPDFVMVSERALIGLRAFFSSFVKYGTKPHVKASRCRSPSMSRRTGASIVGAMF
jgi:hypothetical protein